MAKTPKNKNKGNNKVEKPLTRKEKAVVRAKEARKLRKTGMTIKQIAKKLGCSASAIQGDCAGMRMDGRKHRTPKGEFRGVSKVNRVEGRPWQAEIVLKNGDKWFIGHYETAEEAAKAYDIACALIYGRKSLKLNFR